MDDLGETALHLAIRRGDLRIVKLLLRNGGDVTVRNNDGYTCMDLLQRKERRTPELEKALSRYVLDKTKRLKKEWELIAKRIELEFDSKSLDFVEGYDENIDLVLKETEEKVQQLAKEVSRLREEKHKIIEQNNECLRSIQKLGEGCGEMEAKIDLYKQKIIVRRNTLLEMGLQRKRKKEGIIYLHFVNH